MRDLLISATEEAFQAIVQSRFYSNERGFQGRFNSALQAILERLGIIDGSRVLEEEYQKGQDHGTRQRPDLILHSPREQSGHGVKANNFAVWAFKRRATQRTAQKDFAKLDEMFCVLDYPLGFFVNVDSAETHREDYGGEFQDRLICYGVRLEAGVPTIVRGEEAA